MLIFPIPSDMRARRETTPQTANVASRQGSQIVRALSTLCSHFICNYRTRRPLLSAAELFLCCACSGFIGLQLVIPPVSTSEIPKVDQRRDSAELCGKKMFVNFFPYCLSLGQDRCALNIRLILIFRLNLIYNKFYVIMSSIKLIGIKCRTFLLFFLKL